MQEYRKRSLPVLVVVLSKRKEMKPSTQKIYNLLQSKHTAHEVAQIMGWKVDSARRTIHDLMQDKLVIRFGDGYISTYVKEETSIKAHNPFNL